MSSDTTAIEFNRLPGNFARRLHQISVAIFLQETEAFGITPVQFAALQSVLATPDMDQRTLAGAIGQDASTTTGVIDRLEARGLMQRRPSPTDRRARCLSVTDEGRKLLQAVTPAVLRAQDLLLEPLPEHERAEFMRLIAVLVDGNNGLSRAPRKTPDSD
ncbi:MarR family winged helix-turn-helix transcriptional regulator [Pusillimonas sp.]|uniref:MarR family winged helix-turn-helix transcriptional regulator n=1 Tax=Pusillimonas sp. TaxID=3040095 RepID=UPI0029B0A685|nr:MarR family winged helix-turn-helix transcriptional regulator [Pusillimonas sp.]MDX3893333.1 MarR family winged helix-turn-helix transcriptional regulator [Pusillimonas sp.]